MYTHILPELHYYERIDKRKNGSTSMYMDEFTIWSILIFSIFPNVPSQQKIKICLQRIFWTNKRLISYIWLYLIISISFISWFGSWKKIPSALISNFMGLSCLCLVWVWEGVGGRGRFARPKGGASRFPPHAQLAQGCTQAHKHTSTHAHMHN